MNNGLIPLLFRPSGHHMTFILEVLILTLCSYDIVLYIIGKQ